MPTRGVTLGQPKQRPETSNRGFAIGHEESEQSTRPDHFINPKILILAAVGVVFFLFTFVYDPAPPRLTLLQQRIKDERVMERQMNHLKEQHKVGEGDLSQTMKAIERQILNVSRAEAVADRSRAKQELRKLMFMDGGHADSPLYKFCVSRIKEYV